MKKEKVDRHHLLWDKSSWNKGYCKALRSHWYFVVTIPRNTLHAQIHYGITRIPPPRGMMAKDVYEQVIMLESYGSLHKNDSIEKRLNLLIMLFSCAEEETANALRHELDLIRKYRKIPQ